MYQSLCMPKSGWFVFLCLLMTGWVSAQEKTDSLLVVWKASSDPTEKTLLANAISRSLSFVEPDSARLFAHMAISGGKSLDDKQPLAKGYYNLGLAYHVQGQYDSAVSNYEKALVFRTYITDQSLLAGLANNLGAVYGQKGLFTQALEYYLESLDLKLASGNYREAATTLNNIGIIKYDQEEYQEALAYYRRSIRLDEQANNPMGLARSIGNTGLIHLEMKQYDSALLYYTRAFAIIEAENVSCLKMYPANGLGQTYLEMGSLTQASYFARMALEEARDCTDPVVQSSALLTLGRIDAVQGDRNRAESRLLTSHQLAQDNDLRQELEGIREVLFDFYKAQGDESKALAYLESLMQLKDSLFNEGLTKKLVTMELSHAFEQEKDSINYRVEREKVTLEGEIKRRNILIWATGVALLLAIGIVLLYVRANRFKQRTNQLLTEKNKVVTEALAQKEELFREMHHRVKNNLQIVSSLLNVQSRILEDEQAKAALKETKSRVISMALVHQHLYQQKDELQVYVDTYLESLIDSLNNSFESASRSIDIVTEIDHFLLDSDRAINLGFIFNELITNSYKHAFPDNFRGKPRIDIRLKRRADEVNLLVSDNGIGLKAGQELSRSYGISLMESLSIRMDGTLKFSNGVGTTVSLNFPVGLK